MFFNDIKRWEGVEKYITNSDIFTEPDFQISFRTYIVFIELKQT